MGGTVTVMEQEDYALWLNDELPAAGGAQAELTGEGLFNKLTCIVCHSGIKGAQGPDLKGMFGTEGISVEGETFTRDDDYIRQSILDPGAITVDGFTPGIMRSFKADVSEEELQKLIDYVKTK